MKIATKFNIFFANIGQNLANDVIDSPVAFEIYIRKVRLTIPTSTIALNEYKYTFFSLKLRSDYDSRRFNVIKQCFGNLCEYIFDLPF